MWNSVEQEVLEREIGRLRALYQQQQQPQTQAQQQPSGSHRRSNSRDLESQFANLSLKHKDTNSGQDPALRIQICSSCSLVLPLHCDRIVSYPSHAWDCAEISIICLFSLPTLLISSAFSQSFRFLFTYIITI